jgi:hypothetical protein
VDLLWRVSPRPHRKGADPAVTAFSHSQDPKPNSVASCHADGSCPTSIIQARQRGRS